MATPTPSATTSAGSEPSSPGAASPGAVKDACTVVTAGDVEVTDSGQGIDTSAADRLFDRFFRGDPSHARTIEGTGLGLAIVRSIARVHGGTVAAKARPEGGSTFSVTLPAEPDSFTDGS